MKKEILIVFVCASLMLVTPFTVVARENKISSKISDQPDVEGLVAQLHVVIDEIVEDFGHIPMVRGLCNKIIDSLDLFGNIIICIFLFILLIPFSLLLDIFLSMGILLYTINWIVLGILMLMDDYCHPLNSLISNLPFKSIYTLSETNDISDFSDCPCLQE